MNEVIHASNICLDFQGQEILDIPELRIYEGERIGLIGLNGSGKTSLLKILSNELAAPGSTILRRGSIAFIPQIAEEKQKAFAESDYWASLWGISSRAMSVMSGGEETRHRISRAFAEQATCILADELTAHLDKYGIDLFIEQLRYFPGAAVLVSHDRRLLDEIVHTIWELKDGGIKEYAGNYSDYLKQAADERNRRLFLHRQYIEQSSRLAEATEERRQKAQSLEKRQKGRPDKDADKFGGKNSMQKPMGSKAKSMHKAAKAIEKRLEGLERIDAPEALPSVRFRQAQSLMLNNPYPVAAHGLDVAFDKLVLFDKASFTLPLGVKAALTGGNGSGKTTLLNLISQKDARLDIAQKAVIGSFKQQNLKSDSAQSVLSFLSDDSDYKEHALISMLVQMGFEARGAHKELRRLSGGELTKLMLIKMLSGRYNILLLDEPSAFLDTCSVEALEHMMKAYEGTLLFVSHDEALIERVADVVFSIENKKIVTRARGV